MEIDYYKKAFVETLKSLNEKNNYDSVARLKSHIDEFNRIVNRKGSFNSKNMKKDIEDNFNRIYLEKKNKKKNELSQKKLKPVENINETFEDFIKKQNLNFEFEIKNEEFQFYGSRPEYDNYYDNLRKIKTFKIESKDVFLDIYKTQKLELSLKIIDNLLAKTKKQIDDYFSSLKFKEKLTRIIWSL